MVSFAAACLFSALEGEAKFWITLYLQHPVQADLPMAATAKNIGASKLVNQMH